MIAKGIAIGTVETENRKMHTTIPRQNQLKHAAAHAVAVVTLGNPLRGDDAIATHLLAGLPAELSETLCILDAGSYTRDLPDFLHNHDLGIVTDATASNDTVILDLSDLAQCHQIMPDCSHALSWLDEIVLFKHEFSIPQRLLFVGLPTYESGWHEGLSTQARAKLPSLIKQFCELIEHERADNA